MDINSIKIVDVLIPFLGFITIVLWLMGYMKIKINPDENEIFIKKHKLKLIILAIILLMSSFFPYLKSLFKETCAIQREYMKRFHAVEVID